MLKEHALEQALEAPDFLAISGSRLYGTNREGSDYDYRGFVFPPYEYVLNIATFKDADIAGADHKVYSAKRFLELVLGGDPQCTELFYVPDHLLKMKSELGQRIMELKDDIVSAKIYRRIMGYGYSEWRKAEGVRLKIADRGRDEDDIIAWIRDHKKWDKDRMDEFCEWMDEDKEKKLVPSTRNLGEKRKKEFEAYGFGVSSAAHALRLSEELVELLIEGHITFPRPNADVLRDIRLGKYSLDEVREMYEESRAAAEALDLKKVALRSEPDREKVWKVYSELVAEFIHNDDRFNLLVSSKSV